MMISRYYLRVKRVSLNPERDVIAKWLIVSQRAMI